MTTPANNWLLTSTMFSPQAFFPPIKQTDFYYGNEIAWVYNNQSYTQYITVDATNGVSQTIATWSGLCASIDGYSNTVALFGITNSSSIDIGYSESIEPSIGVSPFNNNFLQALGTFSTNGINYTSVGAYNIVGSYTNQIVFDSSGITTVPTTAVGVYAANYSPTSSNKLTFNNYVCIVNFATISNVFSYTDGAYSHIVGKGTPSSNTLTTFGSKFTNTVTTTQQNSFFMFSFDSNLSNIDSYFNQDYSGTTIASFIPRNMIANNIGQFFIYDSEPSSGNAGLISMNYGTIQEIFSITTTGTASTTNYITAGDIDLFGNEIVAVFNFRGVVQYNSQNYVSSNNGSNVSCLMVIFDAISLSATERFYQFGGSTDGNIYTSVVKNGAPGSIILSGSASPGTFDMFGKNLITTGTNNAWLASFDLQ